MSPRRLLPLLLLFLLLPAAGSALHQDGWEELSSPPFTIRYRPGSGEFARDVAERAGAFRRDISLRLGLSAQGPFTLTIAQSREELTSLMPGGHAPPTWAAALAFPRRGTVFLLSPGALGPQEGNYWQVVHHEMVHLVVGEAALKRETAFPRWLDEGLATYLAGEMTLPRLLHLGWAQVTGQTIPFGELENDFPEGSGRAEVAYAQSYLFVRYLAQHYGPEAVPKVVAALLREGELDGALRSALGVGWEEALEGYGGYSRFRATWIPVLTSTGTVWGVMTALFLFTYLRKRSVTGETRRRWAEEEAVEDEWIRVKTREIDGTTGGRGEGDEGAKPTLH